jgi:hypothetical protein
MKYFLACVLCTSIPFTALATAQQTDSTSTSTPALTVPVEKPRVFITDSNSWETRSAIGGSDSGFAGASSGGARPQTAEIIKTFGQRCPGIVVNGREQLSDYIVELDHEGGKGLLAHKDKVAVFLRASGDSIFSKSTLSVGGSVQDACDAILKHWVDHSAELRPVPAPAAIPVTASTQGSPAAVSMAHLNLTSNPDHADIEIDGSFVGNTPSMLDLPPGDQNITISKMGFKPWTRKIKVTGGTISVFAELDPSSSTTASK